MEWHIAYDEKKLLQPNYPEVQLQALKPEILICLMVPLASSKAHWNILVLQIFVDFLLLC